MKHKHNHECCDHCLHHCSCCNKVYCCKCDREWENQDSSGTWTITPYTLPYTITCGGTGTDFSCLHNH